VEIRFSHYIAIKKVSTDQPVPLNRRPDRNAWIILDMRRFHPVWIFVGPVLSIVPIYMVIDMKTRFITEHVPPGWDFFC
jgi:hypothetical protein